MAPVTSISRPTPKAAMRGLLALAAASVAVRAIFDAGGGVRVASLVLRRLRYGKPRAHPPEESRLYARGHHRFETHLGRRPDGRRVVVALSVEGHPFSAVYRVGESDPWHDFERQAGLAGAAWGPCRSVSAGL